MGAEWGESFRCPKCGHEWTRWKGWRLRSFSAEPAELQTVQSAECARCGHEQTERVGTKTRMAAEPGRREE